MERVIAKGAEADLVLREWNGLKALSKIRKPKGYRHPELDSRLRRSRTKAEADTIHRAKLSGVPTPLLYHVDPDNAVIVMEYVDGVKVRDAVDRLTDEERRELFTRIGGYAGRLHGAGIIHGDLTTSNILKQGDRLVFIDFGLAEVSTEVEKRGVDLNLMNRMLTSTHYRHQEELLAAFVEGYRETLGKEAEEALMRMEEVAKRGRYIEKN
ncbi:MAG TPA: Kae1-associated kinase Bud32 [Candidatus Krumholzibacteriaceae bacterium]|nr:Kae1-associated kinase Bud32 [Candidatus Krumholzibacteriaceae bacterium]